MSDEQAQQPPAGPAPEAGTEDPKPAANAVEEAPPPPKMDPIRRVTRIVLIVCAVIFVWYLFADRITPYTDQARVKALLVPVVPRVSGYLTEVNVRLHSIVKPDEVMFVIDQRPYLLAVRSAEANLDNTAQQVGAQTAAVKSAAGRVGVSKAQLDRAQRNWNRTQAILDKNPGALSQADRDRTETSLASAIEKLSSAEADLEKAKEQLGVTPSSARPSPPSNRPSSTSPSPYSTPRLTAPSRVSISTSDITRCRGSRWPRLFRRRTCGYRPTCGRTTFRGSRSMTPWSLSSTSRRGACSRDTCAASATG